MADDLAVAKLQADEVAARAPPQEEGVTGTEGDEEGGDRLPFPSKKKNKTPGQYDAETGLRNSVV